MIRVLAALLVLGTGAALHPLHTTFTEVNEDPATHAVTITVRSFSDDLARAIGIAPAPAGAVAALPDSALARYIRTHLTLIDRTRHPLTLRYIGQRQTADLTWITFVLSPAAALAGATLANHLQSELYPDQVNLVQATYGDTKQTLLFSPGDGARTLP